jgi:hypothetical protein
MFDNDNLLSSYDWTSIASNVTDIYLNNGTAVNNTNGTAVTTANIGQFQDDMKSTVITVQLVIDDILFTLILWAGLYFIEKVIILYITIHYNARSNFGKLQRSKDVISALAELYKTSTYLYPKHKGEFSTDDAIIHNSPHSHHRDLKPVGAVSRFVGTSARGLTSALGG